MAGNIHHEGSVAIVSRSGTLTYEIVAALSANGYGQSTVIGIGGDPIVGTSFIDALELFEADPQTRAIVLIGEIGGSGEENAAAYIKERVSRPVVGFITGAPHPRGVRMGPRRSDHPGTGRHRSREDRRPPVRGAKVAESPTHVPSLLEQFGLKKDFA